MLALLSKEGQLHSRVIAITPTALLFNINRYVNTVSMYITPISGVLRNDHENNFSIITTSSPTSTNSQKNKQGGIITINWEQQQFKNSSGQKIKIKKIKKRFCSYSCKVQEKKWDRFQRLGVLHLIWMTNFGCHGRIPRAVRTGEALFLYLHHV